MPFRPIIEEGEKPFAMLTDLWIKHREWVFEPIYYSSVDALVAALHEKIIRPAEARFVETPGEEGAEDEGGACLADVPAGGRWQLDDDAVPSPPVRRLGCPVGATLELPSLISTDRAKRPNPLGREWRSADHGRARCPGRAASSA